MEDTTKVLIIQDFGQDLSQKEIVAKKRAIQAEKDAVINELKKQNKLLKLKMNKLLKLKSLETQYNIKQSMVKQPYRKAIDQKYWRQFSTLYPNSFSNT